MEDLRFRCEKVSRKLTLASQNDPVPNANLRFARGALTFKPQSGDSEHGRLDDPPQLPEHTGGQAFLAKQSQAEVGVVTMTHSMAMMGDPRPLCRPSIHSTCLDSPLGRA